MADVTWPQTSSVEETLAQLDALNAREAATRAHWLGMLRRSIEPDPPAISPAGTDDEPGPPPPARHPTPVVRRPEEEWQPAVKLPERTTKGGDFGPAVKAKLIAELTRSRW